jgi:hypothetical protein
MRCLLFCIVLTGCGRWGFSERTADDLPDAPTAPADVPTIDAPFAPCVTAYDGPNYDDGVSTGPDLMGVKIVAPQTLNVTRIEVFTGEVAGASTLALWTHSAATDAPSAAIGTGTFEVALPVGWQGAELATPIPIAAGTTFWMVWDMVNNAQSTIEVYTMIGPNLSQYRGSFDGGQTWNGPFQTQIKLRLWCDGARP